MATQNQDDGVKFGKYNGEDLWWDVLWEDDYKRLLMCRSCFGSSYGEDWKGSERRKYLNGDFFKTVFSASEKICIVNSFLADQGTKDNVFIMSYDEMKKYAKKKYVSNKNIMLSRTIYRPDGKYYYMTPQCTFDYTYNYSCYNRYSAYIYPCLYLKK